MVMCTFLVTGVQAQASDEAGIWNDVLETAITGNIPRDIVPSIYRTLELNTEAVRQILNQAPMEFTAEAQIKTITLDLPLPYGGVVGFRIEESPIMDPLLGAKYPDIKTYRAYTIGQPSMTARFDFTPTGFHAMIFTGQGTVFIDPYHRNTTTHYISYFKRDLPFTEDKRLIEEGPFDELGMAEEIARLVELGVEASGTQLRTYRTAVATTGEYTTFHGGTVAAGLAAVVTAMNRVNAIYDREVAIRMELVANNDLIIYTNSATDPYTNSSGSTMLGQNQTNLNNVIGTANYDLGHVFSTGGGGVASLGSVCTTSKARGVTGLPSPVGDPFYVDYVAHEIGHQFGGNHTFNGSSGSCSGGNRSSANAYEPGSGTTIMAYAGICSPQNTQNYSDDYFHLRSIIEIVAFSTTGSGNGCAAITATGNNPPVVTIPTGGFSIPINTPFQLTGFATDPNGDEMTFCWEEYDLGAAGAPNSPVGTAPIFRSFLPVTSPTRLFPRLSDILNNTQTMGEILPTYDRALNFRLTARDNKSGGGGVGYSPSLTFSATAAAGPFLVTSPNTAVSWVSGAQYPVTWNVANTDVSPVNCANVRILLSTDGGQTFPHVLLSSTSNDGSETVQLPGLVSATARIKIEAVGNVFFDLSNTNFQIIPLGVTTVVSPTNNSTEVGLDTSVVWRSVNGASMYSVQVGTDSTFAGDFVVNDSTLTDTTSAVTGLAPATMYFWRARASNGGSAGTWTAVARFSTTGPPPEAVTVVSPVIDSIMVSDSVRLVWNPTAAPSSKYWVEWSTDSLFTTSVIDSLSTDTTRVLYALQDSTTYYWRVRGRNLAGWGAFSDVGRFSTVFEIQVCITLNARWNLVSLPVHVANDSAHVLFPGCQTACGFAYVPGSGYHQRCTFEPGTGYWMNCQSGATCIQGVQILSDSIPVQTGWNFIGSISVPVSVAAIATVPPGIINSYFYKFANGYERVETIEPGGAYWIKVAQPGVVVLDGGALPPDRPQGFSTR